MAIEIRLGTPADVDAVGRLYDELTDHLTATVNYPGWTRGEYPTRQDAAEGVAEGCLFVAVDKSEIVGSMILRPQDEDAYAAAPWQATLTNSEVLVLHTFAVSPKRLHQGLGRMLLAFALQHAAETKAKALRLDVYEKNLPAIRLYELCGFKRIARVSLGLEEYGLDWFLLYEKLL